MAYSFEELGLVDAPPESIFDNLTKLATSLFDIPVSLVSIVDFDNNRQYFKSQLGLVEPWAAQRQTPVPTKNPIQTFRVAVETYF